MVRWLLLVIWLGLASAAQAAPTAAELARLKAGETITRPFSVEGMDGVEALFMVDARPETVFQILSDTARLAEFMPTLSECTVLEQGTNFAIVRMQGEQGEMVQRRSYDPPYRVTWKLIQGRGLKDVKGRWLIEPTSQGTVLSYGVAIQMALPVPQALIHHFQNRNLPALVRNVRARVESDGKWVKPDYKK